MPIRVNLWVLHIDIAMQRLYIRNLSETEKVTDGKTKKEEKEAESSDCCR